MKVSAVAISVLILCSPLSRSDDFFGAIETADVTSTPERSWRHRAWVTQKAAYGYRAPAVNVSRDGAGLSRAETELYGEFDWNDGQWRVHVAGSLIQDWLTEFDAGYELNDEQKDARRWRFEVADTYLSWQNEAWWLKGGYQTLAWGEAESVKVIDVLARRDQRWPGQADLKDLRLPVPALLANWRNVLDLVLLFETPTDRRAAAYDEFDPAIAWRSGDPTFDPAFHFETGESPGWALRWQQRWQGTDAQLILADVYSYETGLSHSVLDTARNPSRLQRVEFAPWRQQIAGFGVQTVRGNWLFRTEQARHNGVRVPATNGLAPWAERDQWRAMVGADYSGINNLSLSGEFSWRYINDWDRTIAAAKRETGTALRARYALFNERLTLEGFALRLNDNAGKLLRLAADWDVSDRLGIRLSLVEYSAERGQPVYPYRHNDTLLLSLRWNL